jgi:LacI family transcriptional regulator
VCETTRQGPAGESVTAKEPVRGPGLREKRVPTLKDVARIAGVHPSTVSRALDPAQRSLVQEDTLIRIREVADEIGYRMDGVARSLRRRETKTVAVVVTDLGNPVFAPVLRGIAGRLEDAGYIALITETRDDHERLRFAIDKLHERRVDAFVIAAARRGDADLLKSLVTGGMPVVLVVRSLSGTGIPSVTAEDVSGGELAAAHLADLGHRRVAQLTGHQDVRPFFDRSVGFRRAAEERGLSVVDFDAEASDPNPAAGAELTELLLSAGGEIPTAIFAHNDAMAIGALDVLKARGLDCPADVSVLGFNDAPFSDHVNPSLTTIGFPGERIGIAAAELALSVIEEPDHVVGSIAFPPVLVQRESTAPPPSQARRLAKP